MSKNYQIITGLCLLIIGMYSCGYRMTEEDKYPDMPIYPQTTNSDYSIDSLIKIDGSTIKYTEQFLYTISYKSSDKDPESAYLRILNKKMDIVKEIRWLPLVLTEFSYNVDQDNNIYFICEDKKLYKYAYPWDHPVEIPKILDATKRDSLENVYATIIKKRKEIDSSFYTHVFIDSIFNSKIKKIYDINDCVLPIDAWNTYYYVVLNDSNGRQSYAIVTDYSELWEPSYQNRKLRCDSLIRQYTFNNKIASPNLILDQATLGNNSSGNHFVFGFIPYGYDYYKITIGGDSILFKMENDNLDYPLFYQIGSLFSNQIILCKKDVLYTIRKKNE